MKLEDLIDLEAQVAADADQPPEALRARDRELFRKLEGPTTAPTTATDPDDRDALLSAWVRALRGEHPSLGQRVAGAYRLLSYLLVVLGAAIGWGAAAVLLDFDHGRSPVNVANFLLVVVGAQLALLVGLLVGLPLARAFPGIPLVSDLRLALRWLAGLLERGIDRTDDRLSPERREVWRAARARLRARASLYAHVERYVLLGLTQVFGVAFNLAVLACCAQAIVFSDLAFAWSTTLQVEAADFHRVVRALAAPWGWALPEAVPSLEMVELTRYSRLEGAFLEQAADKTVVGGWWRFLIAATVVYGLLPRALLLGIAWIGRARALRTLPLDAPDVDRVVRRLRAPLLETQAAQHVDVAQPTPSRELGAPSGAFGRRPADPGVEGAVEGAEASGSERGAATATATEPASVVLWRDLPAPPVGVASALRASLGVEVARTVEAGGLDAERDRAACQALAQAPGRVLVIAEGWEAPDKSVRAFLGELRAALGPRRSVLVLLVDEASGGAWQPADAADVAVWRDRLALLEDNYLGVEPLEAEA